MGFQQISEALGIDYVALPLIATSIVGLMIYWYSITERFAKYANKLRGPPTLPIIGNAHYLIGKSHNGQYRIVALYEFEFLMLI